MYLQTQIHKTNNLSVISECLPSQLVRGLISGEEEFVKEMKTFISHQLNQMESSRHVPMNILNQKETIFRNIKDVVTLHERYHQRFIYF